MKIFNGIEIENIAISQNLKRLINQTYKLLPNNEEGLDWKTPLSTIIEEFSGMCILIPEHHDILFSLLCKLEGLNIYETEESFYLYRRTIFECLGLIKDLKDIVEGEQNE